MAKSTKRIHQMTIAQWEAAFPDDAACKVYLTRHRWPLGVRCARCGAEGPYDLSKSRPFHWQCHQCAPQGYRFSVLAGTIFENTNLPLRMWFRIIHMMLTSKKGVSALQVHRTLGTGSYKTAWYACHRIRAGLADKDFNKLMGIVEVDETFIGGKAKNRHKDQRGDAAQRVPTARSKACGATTATRSPIGVFTFSTEETGFLFRNSARARHAPSSSAVSGCISI